MNKLKIVSLAAMLLLGYASLATGQLSNALPAKLSADEEALVESSKKAIIETGISKSYFNRHFSLIKVFNQTSDRRVMWKFEVNGYESIINDSIGSTSIGGKPINIHSVNRKLGQTREITQTISRSRALRALKSCIGNYLEPYVEFGQVDGRAELFLVGTQRPKVDRREQESKRKREEAEERARRTGVTDAIENEEGEKLKSPVIIGYINLQTGRCTRGKGVLAKEGL